MNMKVDAYTGETYDADRWYRGENGIWQDREAVRRHQQAMADCAARRRAKRNENRVLRGKRRKSPSEFSRATKRYDEYLSEDSGLSFGEWLRDLKFRRRI